MHTFAPAIEDSSTTPIDPFEARFGCRIPNGLRADSAGLSWSDFRRRYSPHTGDLALATWSATSTATGTYSYDALIDVAGVTRAFHTVGAGPIAALTAMLHEAGRSIEILSFHQRPVAAGLATFVRCEHEGRRRWAVAISDCGTDSALRAVIAAANILSAAS